MIVFFKVFAELKSYYTDHRAIYTDGSKTENRVAAAATSDGLRAQVRLPGNASIFTAELQALKMAFNIVKNCDEDRFIIFSDSLSSLQALDSNNSLPDDPPWTVQKPHIDLYLTHQKKHLGDDCLFQSIC